MNQEQSSNPSKQSEEEAKLYWEKYEKALTIEQYLEDAAMNPVEIENIVEGIPKAASELTGDDSNLYFAAIAQLRFVLDLEDPPIEEVIRTGAVCRMVEILGLEYQPRFRLEAAKALFRIITEGRRKLIDEVIQHGAIPMFVQLLIRAEDDDLTLQGIKALLNIAYSSPAHRDLVLGNGAVQPLLSILQRHTQPDRVHQGTIILQSATNALLALCSGSPPPPFEKLQPALPVLRILILLESLNGPIEVIHEHACKSLECLSYGGDDIIQGFIDVEICGRLITLLNSSNNYRIQKSILKIVENFFKGSQAHIQTLIDNQILARLGDILTNQSSISSILRRTCRTISVLTNHSSYQIQRLVDVNIIPPMVQLCLDNDNEHEVKWEAAYVISSAMRRGSYEQIRHMVDEGCLQVLCNQLLYCHEYEKRSSCIEGISNLLRSGQAVEVDGINPYAQMITESGALNRIKDMKDDPNVGERARRILKQYWPGER